MQVRITGSDDYSRLIKALIVGEPGSGKTLISSTFPNPFFISAEGGLMSIADKQIPYAVVESSDDLFKVKTLLENPNILEAKGLKVQTIVIDTIDEIQRFLMTERMESENVDHMRMQDWGWMGEQMSAICRGFRNMPYHVVFTCHQQETTDQDSGVSYYKLALGGAIKDQLPGYVDLSLAIQVQQDTVMEEDQLKAVMMRKLLTFPTKKYPFLKDRSGKLPAWLEVNLEDDFENINELIYGSIDDLPSSDELDIDDKALTLDGVPAETVSPDENADKVVDKAADSTDTEEASDEKLECAECGTTDFGDFDTDMAKLMYRKVLCREHFDKAKKAENR